MLISIINPNATIYEGRAISIQFMGLDGSFCIMKNHAPLFSILAKSNIIITEAETLQEIIIPINSGVVEVSNNQTMVLTTI